MLSLALYILDWSEGGEKNKFTLSSYKLNLLVKNIHLPSDLKTHVDLYIGSFWNSVSYMYTC